MGKTVKVFLKQQKEIIGQLESFDEYMNLRLKSALFQDRILNDVLVRCNNVLFIQFDID